MSDIYLTLNNDTAGPQSWRGVDLPPSAHGTMSRMPNMELRVLRETPDVAEVGAEPCVCGGCRPMATVFRDDPAYRQHDPALAEGPCCCDRFFVVGPEAEERVRAMAEARRGADAYRYERQELPLPWGVSVPAIVADLR